MTSSRDGFAPFALPSLPGGAGPALEVPSGGVLPLPELDPTRLGGPAPMPGPARTEADEAYERGFADGLREGAARVQPRVRTALEALGRVGEYLHTAHTSFLRDRARDLHGLALAVAKKLVQREIAADPAVLRELIDRALELVPAEPQLEVRLHPDDLAALGEGLAGAPLEGAVPGVRWVPDPELERGGFLVESPLRLVDGRTDFALRSLYERLEYE